MTIENLDIVKKPEISSLFYLNILKKKLDKYTKNEYLLIIISTLSIIGIPIILIPFLCNDHIFDFLSYSIKNERLKIFIFIPLYIISIFYHYICIILSPFIMMIRRNV